MTDTRQDGTSTSERVGGRPADVLERVGRWLDTPKAATALHWVSLAAALVVLLVLNRHQWFQTDEWNFLVDRGLVGSADDGGIWDAHNEHWSTLPVLAYRALFTVFGVRTYLPYLLVMILLHLLAVHLLWRLLRRMDLDLMVATCGCAVIAVLGAGWENLTQAFQSSFIAAVAAGLGALLVIPEKGPFQWRDVAGWGLGIVAVMSAGVGLTMVGVVALVTLLARGLWLALAAASVPAAAYGLWYVIYGPDPGVLEQQSFAEGLADGPAFVWRGLTDAVDNLSGLVGIGAAVLVVLFVWFVRAVRPAEWRWKIAMSMAVGSGAFLLLVGLRRSVLGIDQAGAARYTYVVVVLLLPLLLLAVERGLRDAPLRLVVLFGVTALLVLVQVRDLRSNANATAEIEQEQKRRIVATAELLADGEPVIFPVPVPLFIPNLSTDEIASLDADGLLPGNVHPVEQDLLTARAYIQVVVGTASVVESRDRPMLEAAHGADVEPAGSGGCVTVVPASDAPSVDLLFEAPGSVGVTTDRSAVLSVQVRDAAEPRGPTSRPRSFPTVGGEESHVSFSGAGFVVVVGIPADGETELCGLEIGPDLGR